MYRTISNTIILLSFLAFPVFTQAPNADEFSYGKDKIKIYFIGHGTLMIDFNGVIIHIDPVQTYAKYENQPKADIILITHAHGDHLDKGTIDKITKKETTIILNQESFGKLNNGIVLTNGKSWKVKDIVVEAVPAYNTTEGRDKYHPKSRDNGYVLTLGNTRIYIAGDTEDIPEMKNLKNIEIAFLSMNQPYTMTPQQVVNAVKMIKPKIVYPYHFGDTDTKQLEVLFKDIKDVELRIRNLK